MMKTLTLNAAAGALLVAAALSPTASSRSGGGVGPGAAAPCPDQKTYTGKYRNMAYGFSIVIPAGLKGYWNSARCAPDEQYGCVCMGDHGRSIPLSGGGNIEAYVGYAMEDGWSARDHENRDVSNLRREKGVGRVEVSSSRWVRLGKLKGRRYVVQFNEKNRDLVVDNIIAVHRGVEYQLTLRTPADRYRRDRLDFEKVVSSWRLTPRLE